MAEVVSWLWSFGDGETSNQELPDGHRYREAGVYTVTRTATLANGSTVSFSRVVVATAFSFQNLRPDYEKVIYRHGRTIEEGLGPSEIQGEEFPFLAFGSSALNIIDVTGVPRFIVFDNDDRRMYEITTVGGAEGLGRDVVWRDKCDMTGEGGTEYSSSVYFRGVTGTYERYFVEMLSSNIYTRPVPPERAGVGVTFDQNGYPAGLTADVSVQADELDGEFAEALTVSMPKHEVHFDRRVEGHVLQVMAEFNKAPHFITGYNANVLNKDKLDAPGKRGQTEESNQQTLSVLLKNWVTRASFGVDRVTGVDLGVAWAGDTIVGPDEYEGSALEILPSDTLNFTTVDPTRCLFWFLSGTAVGSLPTGYEVIETLGSWVFAQVVDTDITFGEGYFFDIRTYTESDLTADFDTVAREYLFNDISRYNGSNTLPAWVS